MLVKSCDKMSLERISQAHMSPKKSRIDLADLLWQSYHISSDPKHRPNIMTKVAWSSHSTNAKAQNLKSADFKILHAGRFCTVQMPQLVFKSHSWAQREMTNSANAMTVEHSSFYISPKRPSRHMEYRYLSLHSYTSLWHAVGTT